MWVTAAKSFANSKKRHAKNVVNGLLRAIKSLTAARFELARARGEGNNLIKLSSSWNEIGSKCEKR